MNNNLTNKTITCPFCSNVLLDDPDHCKRCGAEMKKGYIDRSQRRWVFILRLILLIISSLTFFYLQPVHVGIGLIGVYAALIILSLIIPFAFFKLKNKNKNVWIRRPLSW